MASPARWGLVAAFLSYASWGLLSPVGKHLLASGYGPLGLNGVRFILATAVLLPFLGIRGLRDSVPLLGNRKVLVFNALACLSLTAFLYSLELLPKATFATLGFYTAPLWTAALAHFALGERVGPWFWPAAAGLLVGGYLTLFGWAPADFGAAGPGLLLAVASGVVWAVYSVQLRRSAPDIPLRPLAGASFLFGTAYFALLALVVEGPPAIADQTPDSWAWMALYVAVPTLASFVLFNAAMQKAPASSVNLLVGAELGFTAVFAFVLFGERLGAVQWLGLGVVLACITAYLWQRSRTPSPK